MPDPGTEKKPCGRLGIHLGHYWQGAKVFDYLESRGRWTRPIYFCTGQLTTEGGHDV